MRQQIQQHLDQLQQVMQEMALWQTVPPTEEAFLSQQPFAIDYLSANEWLQWIFIPRMRALCESYQPLPRKIAVTPYVEEALKETRSLTQLLYPIKQIESLLQGQSE